MEGPTGKPELQNQNYSVIPYHILIKSLSQLAPEMYRMSISIEKYIIFSLN